MTKILDVKHFIYNEIDYQIFTLCKFEKAGKIVNVIISRWFDEFDIYVCDSDEAFNTICDRHFANTHNDTREEYIAKQSFASFKEKLGDWSNKIRRSKYFNEIDYCLHKNYQAGDYDDEESCYVIENEDLDNVQFNSLLDLVFPDYLYEDNNNYEFDSSQLLLNLTISGFCDLPKSLAILNRDEDNVYYDGKLYTVKYDVIFYLEQYINNSNVFNLKIDDEANKKLIKMSQMIYMDGGMLDVIARTTKGCVEYDLNNYGAYMKYYKFIKEYKVGFGIVTYAISKLIESGIELDEFADLIK